VKQLLRSEATQSDDDDSSAASCECVMVSAAHGRRSVTADAVVLACGAREAGPIERSSADSGGDTAGSGGGGSGSAWIAGSRTARVFHTTHVLDLIGAKALPSAQPLVLGSDLVAYGSAAKLHSTATNANDSSSNSSSSSSSPASGSSQALMVDSSGPSGGGGFKGWLEPWIAKLYFSRYAPAPSWQGSYTGATLFPAPVRGSSKNAFLIPLKLKGGFLMADDHLPRQTTGSGPTQKES
jgi:hypothetical protein